MCFRRGSRTWTSASRPPSPLRWRDQEYGYASRDGVLAAAFVRRMERRFGWHTDPADTVAVGDLVQASFSSVMVFSEPGDAILWQVPSYPPFMRAIEDTGRRLLAPVVRW